MGIQNIKQIMKQKVYLKILMGIMVTAVLITFITIILLEPWIGRKIEAKFGEKYKDYSVEIDKVHLSIFTSTIELDSIKIFSKLESGGNPDLKGSIASIKIAGISLSKFLFKNNIDIRGITISNSSIKGKLPFPEKTKPPTISKTNIRIDSIRFDKIDLAIENTTNSQAFSVKEGVLKVYDLLVEKQDTLSPAIFNRFDFNANVLTAVSADSMYTFTARTIINSSTLKTMALDSFSIHPNYKEYDFTARHEFQTDRFEGGFSHIFFRDFSVSDFFKSKDLVSAYIEIGNMELRAFRDNRKKRKHVDKQAFQDMIYNYPGKINIDSIDILSGNVLYIEHAEKANEPGIISFNEIKAKIVKISNNTIYKTEKAFLQLNAEALLMGKGKLTVLLKSRIYDNQNTFSVNGNLSGMDAKDLNPMLEKNAFVYATSGRIDGMNFSFTANNDKATGKMKLLYHGLIIAVKNKRTDKTTAIKEQVSTLMANIIVLNSNPVPNEAVRVGVIDNKRNPERFLLNYCAKSIITGIKSSVIASPKK